MRDVEHESLQNESPIEIIPVPMQKELPAQEKIPSKTSHEHPAPVEKARRAGVWRFILAGMALCLVAAFLLVYVVLPRPQPPRQPAHPDSLAALIASTATPSSVSTDFSTNITVVNGVAYVSSGNGAVYALRTSNGSVLWRQPINAGANGAPLVLTDNGIVYIIAESTDVGPGSIYALRASDGAQLWRYNSSVYLSALTIANGIAYVTTYDDVSQNGSIIALRANNGAQLWHTSASGSYDTPIVDNGVVYVSADRDNGPGTIYALRASDGVPIWHKTTNNSVQALTAANGIIYVFSGQGLAALQANNGQQLWSDALNGYIGPSPQLLNGVLYFTTTKVSLEASIVPTNQLSFLSQMGATGNLLHEIQPMSFVKQTMPLKEGLSSVYAVRVSDGAVLWHYQMSKEYGNNWANWFSLENGTIYVGTYVNQYISYIYALHSSNGSLLWRQTTSQGMSVNALFANGVIYLASFVNNSTVYAGSGAVYALRTSDGARLWYHSINWVVNNPPIMVGTTLYVTTAADDIYAFRASNGSQLWHVYMK